MKSQYINLFIIAALVYALCFCSFRAGAQGGYKVTYTKINFYYSKKVTEHGPVTSGSTTDVCFGQSDNQPTLKDDDGNVTISGGFNATPGGANNPLAVQMPVPAYSGAVGTGFAKSQLVVADFAKKVNGNKSLRCGGMHNASYSGGGGTTMESTIETKASSFYFRYDAVTGMSAISMRADLTIFSISEGGDGGPSKSSKSDLSIGFSNSVVPAIMAGNTPQPESIVITKTATGFTVKYSKNTHTETTNTTETLNATIGEPISVYEAVIQPYNCDYQHWLPAGPNVNGSDDAKGDTKLRFNIVVREKADHTRLYGGTGSINWVLADVTHYPGFCNNYPAYTTGDPDVSADMVFNTSAGNAPSTYSLVNAANDASSMNNSCTDMIANIMCMDYAAWGKLTALVRLQDGTVLTAISSLNPNKTYMTLPYDNDENKVADEWENKFNTQHHDLKWDGDSKPDNQRDNGDGYTLFEEYRGFAVYNPRAIDATKVDTLARTDPDKKDAFVFDKDALFQNYYENHNPNDPNDHQTPSGLDWHYLALSKKQFYYPDDIKAPLSRWVNFNKVSDYFYSEQYCLVIMFSDASYAYDPDMTGGSFTKQEWQYAETYTDQHHIDQAKKTAYDNSAEPEYATKSPLKKMLKIEVLRKNIASNYAWVKNSAGDVKFNEAVEAKYESTVRHEIGHCIGIRHHQAKQGASSSPDRDEVNSGANDGVEDCAMRYLTLDEKRTLATILIRKKNYCQKGQQGPVYYRIWNQDNVHYVEVEAGFKPSDNCYGQISVKSRPEDALMGN